MSHIVVNGSISEDGHVESGTGFTSQRISDGKYQVDILGVNAEAIGDPAIHVSAPTAVMIWINKINPTSFYVNIRDLQVENGSDGKVDYVRIPKQNQPFGFSYHVDFKDLNAG